MTKKPNFVAWFAEVSKKDILLTGGKGANLGELTQAGIPVPPGFIVTSEAYSCFLEKAGLKKTLQRHLQNLDPNDSKQLQEVAFHIQKAITSAPMPVEIAESIKQYYRELGGGLVAVRSSATAEDLPEASFAGQQRTYLNVEGEEEVVRDVQGCWASLFEPRAIFYRAQRSFDHLEVGIAVPVQKMVQSEVSGVVFTIEPLRNDKNKITIEAAYGLGEYVVSGVVTPDLYIVDKDKLAILEKKVARQDWQLVKNPHRVEGQESNIKTDVPEPQRSEQKLSDEEVVELAQLAKKIELLYQFPQDIEWTRERGKFYIVQARPVTTIKPWEEVPEIEFDGPVLLSGISASPGIAAGTVRIVRESSQVSLVEDGDVLVAEMTTPDFVPAMERAVAIVTDRGGRTCHAAIVSREMGVPCVIGTEEATRVLKDGQEVTVDATGTKGKVYDGTLLKEKKAIPVLAPEKAKKIKTKTRVYVNLAFPKRAEAIAARDVDGVGLLRAEFIITNYIGEHPRYMLSQGKGQKFTDRLAQGIETIARAFYPRPVVYRTTDFKTNEYRGLVGGEKYEETEENPMLGYRGCSRYIRELEAFRLETEAIKKVRQSYNNLWVMIPFVRTVKELTETKKIMESEGLVRSAYFKLWMMMEVPSNVFLLDKFIDVGIDGISIGSNDLTQLILGIDRDSHKLAEDFDERDEAVLHALEKIIRGAAQRGVSCSICGQAPSVYPELTLKLVSWGITSVSVNPDKIEHTREIIAEAERKLSGNLHRQEPSAKRLT